MQQEEWREVPDYPGYEISNKGRLVSYKRSTSPREITGAVNGGGYRVVTVCHRGICKTTSIHALVAAAFIGPRWPGAQVRHLDGNPANNQAENLAYGTQSDNEQDKKRHGKRYELSQTHCSRGHEYTAENVYREPGRPTWRSCRTCRRERDRARDRSGRVRDQSRAR